MLMQDNSVKKNVAWIDGTEGKRLVNDDSTNDLLYQENPQPIEVHKCKSYSKSIMKVTNDPFYAECFPPPAAEESE